MTVQQKATVCAQLERHIMCQAGAEPTETAGHYVYQGAPVQFDPSVYRDVQPLFMPEADADKLDIFDGPQLFPDDLPPLSAADAASYANAGQKRREPGVYSVPDELTGDAAELAAWFISIGGEPGNKLRLLTLHDYPFKSEEIERGHDTSFALQIDGDATLCRFQSERATWRAHCEECKAQGKSSQYAAAIKLECPPELAARVWGGEQLIKTVAEPDDFPYLADEERGETLAWLTDLLNATPNPASATAIAAAKADDEAELEKQIREANEAAAKIYVELAREYPNDVQPRNH
ncbi:hypothetical protein [Atlantibacter subterraneus]|uniref:hypothetical protein n=1 Tax=Atlantibacter subterraneus TaxID=255519 RepID=UPI0022EA3E11|nr:hypothetical protein [Atlantibacter subterranea]MDA3134914.1 hypothetical protein [Atlantibacter subterranea]